MDPLLFQFSQTVSQLVPKEVGGSLSEQEVAKALSGFSSADTQTLLTHSLKQSQADLNHDGTTNYNDLAWFICHYPQTEHLPQLTYRWPNPTDNAADSYELCQLYNRLTTQLYDALDEQGAGLGLPKAPRMPNDNCDF
ncbi:MAG: hypothetical protein U0003_01285 [Vampirovibrionales bacterium]